MFDLLGLPRLHFATASGGRSPPANHTDFKARGRSAPEIAPFRGPRGGSTLDGVTEIELAVGFLGCLAVGCVAAMMGLGGGVFLVPFFALGLGFPMREAAATGLVCALATSAAGSVALDKARLADLGRVARLEVPAALGALVGSALLAGLLPDRAVQGAFAAVMLFSAWRMLKRARQTERESAPPGQPEVGPAEGRRELGGIVGFFSAGAISGTLGIGCGPIKVPVQTELMGVPLRVALANANVMVGITAATGAAVYYARGDLPAAFVGPCALGTALGAYAGGLLAPRVRAQRLALAFSAILVAVGLRMGWGAVAAPPPEPAAPAAKLSQRTAPE